MSQDTVTVVELTKKISEPEAQIRSDVWKLSGWMIHDQSVTGDTKKGTSQVFLEGHKVMYTKIDTKEVKRSVLQAAEAKSSPEGCLRV